MGAMKRDGDDPRVIAAVLLDRMCRNVDYSTVSEVVYEALAAVGYDDEYVEAHAPDLCDEVYDRIYSAVVAVTWNDDTQPLPPLANYDYDDS